MPSRSGGTRTRLYGLLGTLVAALVLAVGGDLWAGNAVGSFEIDGNMPDDAEAGDDWESLGIVETVIDDDVDSATDDAFGQGSHNEEPDDWSYALNSIPPKDDIDEAGIYFRPVNGQQFLYLRHTRLAASGNQNFDYEFNATDATYTNSNGFDVPFRTNGDFVVAFDVGKNEAAGCLSPQDTCVTLLEWKGDHLSGEFVLVTGLVKGTHWDGAVSADKTFGEAVVNLTAANHEVDCESVAQAWVKSRASSAINAALKDRTDTVAPAFCDFDVTKVADPTTVEAGGTVEYTIEVTNAGQIAGSTEAKDVYDERVTVVESSLPEGCTNDAENHTVTCDTDELEPGVSQQFTYSATMPSDLGGSDPDPDDCDGEPLFAIVNEVTVLGGEAEATVCVEAEPDLAIEKSAVGDPDDVVPGDPLTFQIDYSNDGNADAHDVEITDAVPAGTTFVSCTGKDGVEGEGCSHENGTVTFDIGTVGPGDEGSVSFVVEVTFDATCEICNQAQVSGTFGGQEIADETSNIVCVDAIPLGDPTLASASGSSFGLHVVVPALSIDETISETGSAQSGPGDPPADTDVFLTTDPPVPPAIASVQVVEATSDAGIDATGANDRSTGTTARVNLLGGAVTASAVHGVADATATGAGATASTFGSHIEDLEVGGVPIEQITYGQQIVVPGVGTLVVYERHTDVTEPADSFSGFWEATVGVNMLHLTVELGPLAGTEVVVSHAEAQASFPSIGSCEPQPDFTVSGEAKVVSAEVGDATVDVVKAGPIPAAGGDDFAQAFKVGPIAGSPGMAVDSDTLTAATEGGFDGGAARSNSLAEIEGLRALQPAGGSPTVTATLVRSEASSTADASGADSTGSTTLVGLTIGGSDVCGAIGLEDTCTPAPNTTIPLGLLTIHLNEQIEDTSGGSTAITVNAIRIEGLPTGDIVIGQAHSDACLDVSGTACTDAQSGGGGG